MSRREEHSLNARIILSGYYGFGNLGDELILLAILQMLDTLGTDTRVIVLSACPERTMRIHGVEAVNRWNPVAVWQAIRASDVVISGGGGLLQDATSRQSPLYYLEVINLALRCRKKVMVWAQGIGPLSTPWLQRRVLQTLSRVAAISVRDERSREWLVFHGLPPDRVALAADPVWALQWPPPPLRRASGRGRGPVSARARGALATRRLAEPRTHLRHGCPPRKEQRALRRELRLPAHERLVGVCAKTAPPHIMQEWRTTFLEREGTTGGRRSSLLVFLPAYPSEDRSVLTHLQRLAKGTTRAMLYEPRTFFEWVRTIAALDHLVSFRLHPLILAERLGIPSTGIITDQKIEMFLRERERVHRRERAHLPLTVLRTLLS